MSKKKKLFIVITAVLILCIIAFLVVLFVKIIPEYREREDHKQAVKQYRDAKFAVYERENEEFDDYEVDVAFLGDSLTDMCDVNKYYPEFVTSNRGIGGDTTFDVENRLELSVYDLKPKVIVMLIGANNIESMFDNYENLLKGFKQNLPQTKIVLCSLSAMGGELWGSRNQIACYNNVRIKKYAAEYGYEFVDLFTPLFNEKTGEVYDGLTIDGGHFTHEGYLLVVEQIKPVLKRLLNV
ncbi:MAG: hypothetical protein IJA97_06585 [Clostridia bacterium]|nr:hypothetical protein [Clostridia bacterium]